MPSDRSGAPSLTAGARGAGGAWAPEPAPPIELAGAEPPLDGVIGLPFASKPCGAPMIEGTGPDAGVEGVPIVGPELPLDGATGTPALGPDGGASGEPGGGAIESTNCDSVTGGANELLGPCAVGALVEPLGTFVA